MTLEKDGVRLSFPAGWEAVSWDERTGFYKRHAIKTRTDLRSVDVVAFDPESKSTWLIEIKDYTSARRSEKTPLYQVLAEKAIDTMGSLHAAAKNVITGAGTDVTLAKKVIEESEKVRFVYIGMEPPSATKLWGTGKERRDIEDALKTRIRCIDAHPAVVDTARWPTSFSWKAEKLP